MPVFIFLVVVAAVVLWLLLSCSYQALGRLISHVVGKAKDAMEEDDNNAPADNDTADN